MSQSCWLILITDQKYLGARRDTGEEVLPFGKSTTRLPATINRRVDLPSEALLRLGESGHNVMHGSLLWDHHDIHVAGPGLGPRRHRAINKGKLNLAGKHGQATLQNLSDTEGLSDKALPLIEHGAISISLKVRLPAFNRAGENPGAQELFKLPLHGPRAKPDRADDLPLVAALVGVAKWQEQHRLARGAEKRGPDAVPRYLVERGVEAPSARRPCCTIDPQGGR